MSDDDSEQNSNSNSNSNSDNEQEEENETQKAKCFSLTSLVITSNQVNISIKSKEDTSTKGLLMKLKQINQSLDTVGTGLSSAMEKYNQSIREMNITKNPSTHINDLVFNSNTQQKSSQVPLQFDSINNPYRKITSLGNTSRKYSNDVSKLYQNSYHIDNVDEIENNSIRKGKERYGGHEIDDVLSQKGRINLNEPVKIYYRRHNEMN